MSNGGRSKRHEDAIGNVAPGLARVGFAAALRKLGVRMLFHQKMVPDAFELDCVAKALTIYEIEATHGITPRKYERIRSLRDQLAHVGWSVRLIHGAASSHRGCEIDIDTEGLTNAELERIRCLMDRA